MAQNRIQFQKGLSLQGFLTQFGTETQCAERWSAGALERWSAGAGRRGSSARTAGARPRRFGCARAGCSRCRHCHHQTSVTAGTIFASTKLALTTWFLALFFLTQQKNGISSLELMRHLGVSYPTAWRVKQKLLQVMKERDDGRRLSGVIQVDDADFGGERHDDTPGRGSPNKVPFIAALACNDKRHPISLRMGKVAGVRKTEAERFAKRHFDPDAIHTASGQHLPRYLGEFCYRFNRRFNLAAMLPRLGWAAVRTPPMPSRLLVLAEPC